MQQQPILIERGRRAAEPFAAISRNLLVSSLDSVDVPLSSDSRRVAGDLADAGADVIIAQISELTEAIRAS